MRAKALPEHMEAPAGLAFRLPLPYFGETGVDPARRACPTSAGASARRRRRLNAPEIQVRGNVSLRMRARTPAHPGGSRASGVHISPVSVCRRGRPRTQARKRAGTPAHPGSHAGEDARPLRRIVRIRRAHFTSLRMQAGTPAHPGDAQSAVSASGRGRPRTQAALSLPSPQAGGDARAPRLACGRGRPRTQADRAHPACTFHQSPYAGGDAHAPRRRSVCRLRKRAGTPAHSGRIWFNHSAHRSKCSISMSPRA